MGDKGEEGIPTTWRYQLGNLIRTFPGNIEYHLNFLLLLEFFSKGVLKFESPLSKEF